MSLHWECFTAPRLRWRYEKKRLMALGARAQQVVPRSFSGEISCAFLGDHAMRKLNWMYRGKDKTTDVLSFLYDERRERGKTVIHGELVLSVPEIRRKARRARLPLSVVTDALIVHGLLHLVGYDHEQSVRAEEIMSELEKRILAMRG